MALQQLTGEAFFNALLSRAFLQSEPNSTSPIEDPYMCSACFRVQLDRRVETALNFRILESNVKKGKVAVDLHKVLRGVASELQPCPFFSYLLVGILTQIFVRYGMEDPWRWLDALFEDRSLTEGSEERRQHLIIRKRKITRLLPRTRQESTSPIQTQLLGAFPGATTFRLLHDYIESQQAFLKSELQEVYEASIAELATEKLSVKTWQALGVVEAASLHPENEQTALKTLDEVMHGTIEDREAFPRPSRHLAPLHALERPHKNTTVLHSQTLAPNQPLQVLQSIQSTPVPHTAAPAMASRIFIEPKGLNGAPPPPTEVDHDPDLIDPDLDSDEDDGDDATAQNPLRASPAEIQGLQQFLDDCDRVKRGEKPKSMPPEEQIGLLIRRIRANQ